MKENFVIREERHPGARAVAKFCDGTAAILGGVFLLGGIVGLIFKLDASVSIATFALFFRSSTVGNKMAY